MQLDTVLDHCAQPLSSAALLEMGKQYMRLGSPVEAERCYRQTLAQEPYHVEALYRLALLCQQDESRRHEALTFLDVAIALAPAHPMLHSTRGTVMHALEWHLDALDSFAKACCLAPSNTEMLYNLGVLYADLCCPAQAEVVARRLLAHQPDWPAARYLLLRALTALNTDSAELEEHYEFLIKSDPQNASLRFALGLQQLRCGHYKQGWDAQEWRWEIEPVKSSRQVCMKPRWAGGDLQGKRLLILGEQGFGDILQFARYLPMLVAKGAHVILQLDENRASLARLLGKIPGVEIVIGTDLPPCDLHCPLASLPYVFGTTVESIPNASYLLMDQQDVDQWRDRLKSLPRPWIGICWAGSLEHSHNVRRSLPLCNGSRFHIERLQREARIAAVATKVANALGLHMLEEAATRDAVPAGHTMEPLLRRTEGSFISLQIGPQTSDLHDLPEDLHERIFAPLAASSDFYDTAALIQALDGVITVDTSVAHLAGSLGKPGLLIKPAAPEWRWIEHQGRCAWYPSFQLMEQSALSLT